MNVKFSRKIATKSERTAAEMVQCVGSESLPYDRSESMGGGWFWAPEKEDRELDVLSRRRIGPASLFFVSPGFLGFASGETSGRAGGVRQVGGFAGTVEVWLSDASFTNQVWLMPMNRRDDEGRISIKQFAI